jgi:DNA/RNA endonuclease G (NUC1)
MRSTISVFVLVLIFCSAPAAARNCTSQERADANAQLEAIEADKGTRSSILTKHLPFGVHRSTQGQNEQLMYQGGYMLSHDPELRTAVWVSYRLDGDDIENATGQDRVNCFRRDPRLDADDAATPTDYKEPTFDQGHMTNDADLKDDLLEQVNTYVMSNMSPQHCRFNRGIWLSLEHLTRIWANNDQYGAILVTSGAVFDRDDVIGRDADDAAIRMLSNNGKERVAVPSHYYKVILRKDEAGWKSIAFLLPHTNTDHGTSWSDVKPDVIDTIVSISEIEELASLRLHPALNRSELTEIILGSDWDFATGRSNFNSSIKDDNACVTSVN